MLMKIAPLLFAVGLIVMSAATARASHIVGGELALQHITGTDYRYKIQLVFYYDFLGTAIGDASIEVSLFSKRDNRRLLRVVLLPTDPTGVGEQVPYFQPACATGTFITYRVDYESSEITLSPTIFNEPEGYYIAWERCCRNYSITNIYSGVPGQAPSSEVAGQIFYLEFPPVIKDGVPFINSSPRLFPPLSDFACPERRYFADFRGEDPDGDSLAYSLVTPLNSIERVLPEPDNGANPGPYPTVTWRPPFSATNIMNGQPDLHISQDGLLTVTPTALSIGIFVFAVKCEEYRNGIKIGEVRRDFQMLVQNACPVASPPVIVGKVPGDAQYSNNEHITVQFDNTVSNNQRCFDVRVTDLDASKFDDQYQENVRLKAIPIGFKQDVSSVLPTIRTATIFNNGEAIFKICLPECPFGTTGIYDLALVVFDDACSIPLSDTLFVTVNQQFPANQLPQFNNTSGPRDITATLEEGDPAVTWHLQVTDGDNDKIQYRIVPVDFTLANAGMTLSLPFTGEQTGPVAGDLVWDPKCELYDFTTRTNFEIFFIADDVDKCKRLQPDTARIHLTIIDLPDNTPPVINNAIQPGVDTLRLTSKIFEPIVIPVTGTDADNSLIYLRGAGDGFSLGQYGATFNPVLQAGQVASDFLWNPACAVNINAKNIYAYDVFLVDSLSKCRFYYVDTLHLILQLEPPDNTTPSLAVQSLNVEQPLDNNALQATLGSPITLALQATDTDTNPTDNLIITLSDVAGDTQPENFSFTATGATAQFIWEPDCSLFSNRKPGNGTFENSYQFTFRVRDGRCFNPLETTVTIDINVQDVESPDTFLPMNFVSPNDDGCNDFFSMTEFQTGPCGAADPAPFTLPFDDCQGTFQGIHIFNRWGKEVYTSDERTFRWAPRDLPIGVYFYSLLFTNRQYRGLVTVSY